MKTALVVLNFLMGQEDEGLNHRADAREGHPEPDDADLGRRETAVEERETVVEARETAVDKRETVVEAREAAQDERMDAGRGIRVAADQRDVVSGARDVAADKRENDLDRADMRNVSGSYGAHWPERRNAGSDRAHAKDDRTASHADRIALTEDDDEHDTDET